MKVLVTTAFDAGNLATENIVKELISRNHMVEIFARFTDANSIRMFTALGVSVFPEKELTPERINQYDIAFCTVDAMAKLRFADIYVFSYNSVMDTGVSEGADFMFTVVRDRKLLIVEDCAMMPVGNAKNDFPKSNIAAHKQFLYVDAGHNPFGYKGKYQVADMLLNICQSFPDYNLVVKPRWILNEEGHQTHRSGLHIYEVLNMLTNGNLPKNLILLNEHRNLQELIDESISVITTSFTVYMDVALRGKGCIVVDGLDAEDQFEIRSAFFDSYEDARRAGCCVKYNDVVKCLPEGIQCNEEHIYRRIPYANGVSHRIVYVMEYIYDNFLRYGKFPTIKKYDFETFQDELSVDLSLTFRELKYKRFKNAMIYRTRIFAQFKTIIDCSEFEQTLEEKYHKYPINASGLRALDIEIRKEISRIILKNKSKLMHDAIDQSFLLQTYYDTGNENLILEIPIDNVLCSSAYYYYLGMIYSKQKEQFTAIKYFRMFLQEANSRSFNKYPPESDWGIRNAYNYIFNTYNGENIPPDEFIDLYISLYEQRNIAIVGYKSRKRAHNWLPKVAEKLADTDPERALKSYRIYAKWEYFYNIRERDEQLKNIRGAKLYRLGEKIKWLVRKLKGGVRCLQEHGWKYTYHHTIEKIKEKERSKSLYRIWSVFWDKVMMGYKLYSETIKKYGDNARLFLSAPSGGDSYIYSSLYGSFIKKNYADCVPVFVSFDGGAKTIPELFSIQNIVGLSIQEFYQLYNLLMFDGQGMINLESLHYHIFYRHTAILTRIEGLHDFNLFSLSQAFLGVSDDEIDKPQFVWDKALTANFFSEYNLIPQKTILLEPYAKSVKSIPLFFWNRLVEHLSLLGFCVCTNSNGEHEPAIKETTSISIPYKYSVPFLEAMGVSIGLRSGFHDVVNTAKCLKITLYTDDWPRSIVCKSSESFCMSKMYHQPDQYDLLYTDERGSALIHEIVQLIVNYFK